MSEWATVRVGEVARVINGDRGKNYPSAKHRVSRGIPFINAGHLAEGRVRLDSMDFINGERFNLLRSGKTEINDVLLCIRGSLGRWALVTNDVVPSAIASSLVILRPGPSILPRFLAYFFASEAGNQTLLASDNGAAQPNVGAQQVSQIQFMLPSLEVQNRIVDILGSIDDLIEGNRRRVQVLEEMVRAIYREWFVKFRYPGHEQVPLVDSAFGPIPKGWKVEAASTAVQINPTIKFDRAVEHPFIAMGDVSETSMVCYPSGTRTGGSGARFEDGDTLLARIHPSLQNGKTGFVQSLGEGVVGLGSTEFIVMRGRSIGQAFTYCLARQDEFRSNAIASMVGASGRQRVRNECFDNYYLAVPPATLIHHFEAIAAPLFADIDLLHRQAKSLSDTRDLLLPKLVTGQIDVSSLNLDRVLEEAVA